MKCQRKSCQNEVEPPGVVNCAQHRKEDAARRAKWRKAHPEAQRSRGVIQRASRQRRLLEGNPVMLAHKARHAPRIAALRVAWGPAHMDTIRRSGRLSAAIATGKVLRPSRCWKCSKVCRPVAVWSGPPGTGDKVVTWLCWVCWHVRKRHGRTST